MLSNTWELGYKSYLYLNWLNELNIDTNTYLDLRLAIAHAAKHYTYGSLNGHVSIFKSIVKYLDIYDFQAWWLTLDTYKKMSEMAYTPYATQEMVIPVILSNRYMTQLKMKI